MEQEEKLDSISNSEYLDAEEGECNMESCYEIKTHDTKNKTDDRVSIISETPDQSINQLLQTSNKSPACIINSPEKSPSDIVDRNCTPLLHSNNITESIDCIHNSEWRSKQKHIFILSSAGKPIYSLHGNENELASIFGIMQALVSFVQHGHDTIKSIHTKELNVAFLVKSNLILVAVSRCKMSVNQLIMQLNDVYNQIVSTLTYVNVTKIFEKRKNFDLRRLLAGSERLIEGLILNNCTNNRFTNNLFSFLTNSVMVLPMPLNARTAIVNIIRDVCSKIKNLVFVILMGNNCLITMLHMKAYSIHPSDLRLIFNLVECSESFKSSENWTPICLPKFDMNGYLHAHVSYLSDECQACLLLLSVDKDDFFILSEAKHNITEKLSRSHSVEVINDALQNAPLVFNRQTMGLQELRHFLYKPKTLAQVYYPELLAPYNSIEGQHKLQDIYCYLASSMRKKVGPLKLIFQTSINETVLAWTTSAYELYAIFEPITEKNALIKYVDKLIKWISKDYDTLFIRNYPTF